MGNKQNSSEAPIPGRSCMKITYKEKMLWKKSLN